MMEDRDRFAGFRSAVNIRMAHADPENALDAAKVSDECFALVTRAYLKHSGLDLLPDRIVGETAILWYRLQQGFL
ncbi:hypothetical protein GCM10022600_27330 [Qipengyuania pelagi]